MKYQRKLLAALTSATLLTGCASGGSGSDQSDPAPRPASTEKQAGGGGCGIYALFDIWGACGGSVEKVPPREFNRVGGQITSKPAFTSWSELPALSHSANAAHQFDTIMGSVTYTHSLKPAHEQRFERCFDYVTGPRCSTTIMPATQGTIGRTSSVSVSELQTIGPEYDGNRELHSFLTFSKYFDRSRFADMQLVGQPAIDFPGQPGTGEPSLATFGNVTTLVANPYKLDWNYQSFGVWDKGTSIHLFSFGAVTPASGIPQVGQASFTGKLAGLYVSPVGHGSTATAEVNVQANFSTRSLSFASTGTSVTRDARVATAAPNLNLNGTLAYSPASNTFTGTLTNAGGTMSGSTTGRYYGPTAQELGGVFAVKSPTTVETFTGAYGAKR